MAKTSIHIQPVKGGSEAHNRRDKPLDYVRADLPHVYWQSQSQADALADIKERYRQSTISVKHPNGQKMQAKATPIREGVVVVDASTTMADLHRLADALQARYGIRCIQIALHQDEGHWHGKDWVPNLHAHMVFDWTDARGKSIKLNAQDMAQMQTLIADVLGMERGESSDKRHLSALQHKVSVRRAALADAEVELEDTTRNIEDAKTTLNVINLETQKAKKERDRRKKEADKESGSRIKRGLANLLGKSVDEVTQERDKTIKTLTAERDEARKQLCITAKERDSYKKIAERTELENNQIIAEQVATKTSEINNICDILMRHNDDLKREVEEHKKSSNLVLLIKGIISACLTHGLPGVIEYLIEHGRARYSGYIHGAPADNVDITYDATPRQRNCNGTYRIEEYRCELLVNDTPINTWVRYHTPQSHDLSQDNDQRESRGLHK